MSTIHLSGLHHSLHPAPKQEKIALWTRFCSDHKIIQSAVPLFELSNGHVMVRPYGRDQRLILQRSTQMNELVITEVQKVISDFKSHSEEYEGLIYMMFWTNNNLVLPLYIGKSEKYGTHQNLSANIDGIEKNNGFFCRWGYNYAYHIGNLSAVVCHGHPEEKIIRKYKKWAERLFTDFPSENPKLQCDTYFWIEAWKRGSAGIWKEYGETSLTFLEYLLIGVASDLFPDLLLNNEGVNRK
ncbi:MAG: hypothetical protein HC911_17085 [Chloroflexaceae bacterium]|nr:hypothetical protein [Chloroflexaceae bacterium]